MVFCDMSLSQTGVIKQYRFYPAVMFSKARLTYNQVAAALCDKEPGALEIIGGLAAPPAESGQALPSAPEGPGQRGAIDFETQETRMVFRRQREDPENHPGESQ